MKQLLVFLFVISSFVNIVFCQNNALNFDGVNDYVELNNVAPQMVGANNFTVEFVMQADLNNQTSSIRTSMFAINPSTNNGNGLLIILGGLNAQDGRLLIYDEGTFGTNADIVSSTVIGDNNCHHIAYVRSGNTGTVYIDGQYEASHSTSYSLSASDLYSIGQEWDNLITSPTTSQFYNGEIDEFRIWNLARTVNQIQDSGSIPINGNEPGLVAYYNFNQGVQSGNNSGLNYLTDNASNSLDGTLNNFVLNGNTSNWVSSLCVVVPNVPDTTTPADTTIITECDTIIIPNVFTPNNDNVNDFFKLTHCDINKIEIYNRWGSLLYSSTDVNLGWDGKSKSGKDCSEGVYYFIAYLNNSAPIRGVFSLIR